MENQSKKMVQIVYDALDEKLGEDIEILKVDEISVIADYLVIANGRNQKNYKKIPCVRDKITLRVISLLHMEIFYCILFERAIKRFYMLCFCNISLEEAV